MEVSGRKDSEQSSCHGDILCQPCQGEDENVRAESYCETCNMFMCSSCLRAHRKIPITKNHVIKSKDEMPRTADQTDPCSELCTIHKTEIVKFYCQSHGEVGCGDCMVVNHKACKVDLVPDVSGNYEKSEELNQVKRKIEYLVKEISSRKHDLKCNLKTAAEMNLKVVEDIKKFRKDMNIYLDNAEEELLKEVEKLRNMNVSLQNKLKDECDTMQKEMEEFQETLTKNTNKINQLFVSAKLAQKKLQTCQESVNCSASECEMMIYKFEPAQDLMTLEGNRPALGTIQRKRNSVLEQSKKRMIDMKAEFLKKVNIQKEKCWISGLAMVSSDEILLADNQNNVLKLLNVKENKITSYYKLSKNPWDMTVINPGSVAVTVPGEGKILIMSTKNGLSESRSLNVRKWCYGIDHQNGLLAVSFCYPSLVQVLNMKGNVLHKVGDTSLFGYPFHIAWSHANESIYVSDYSKSAVHELTLDGKLKATIKCRGGSKPRGVVVTKDGTVIVCCEGISDRVSMIVPTSEEVLSLLVEQVQKPVSILMCEEQNRMYICEHDESKDCKNMKIFNLK